MTIEKIKTQVGWWQARFSHNGELYIGCSDNKLDAIKRLFAQLEWAEVGNWNK